jgi:sigma-B regulation protein RsbU (phosphoserine phosphatase)
MKRFGRFIPIRLKILVVQLGFFSLVAAAFFIYSAATTANYRQLRTDEVSKTVAFESERVGKAIAEMERNAIDLALAGTMYYRTGQRSDRLGASISVENFSAFRDAVGGGVWFEPYALDKNSRRVCYYAFFDPLAGEVRLDPDFETDGYDYHTQMWYLTIADRLKGRYSTVWTAPYYDDAGTNALMTTVGAGIFDERGRFIGMSTVDWQIQSVVDRLSAIRPTENSFVLLASPLDDYIISNTRTREIDQAGSSLKSLPWFGDLQLGDGGGVGVGRFADGGVEYYTFSRMFANGWLFSVQIPVNEIFAEIEKRNDRFTLLIALSSLIMLALASWLLSVLINRPLDKLMEGVEDLGTGNLDRQLTVDSKDEIGLLAVAFNKMTVDLKASIEQIARERGEKERISAELNVAAKIQANMLPSIFPPFPHRDEFDIFAVMQPAKEVGGDFYDFFLVDENTLALVIADVSGKGVPAALYMVIAKTLIKNNAQSGKNPVEAFDAVNSLLCENNQANMFVTVFMGYLDIGSGRFVFANAGHNPPLIKKEGRFDWLKAKSGFVLGGMRGMAYTLCETTLQSGDEIFLYTDGLTEAMNSEKALFGNERLLEAVNDPAASSLPPGAFTSAVKDRIEQFAEGAEQADDITMLILRYKKNLERPS